MGVVPGFPRWSPDGKLIAFHSNPEGQAEAYLIPAAGGKPRNLTSHPGTDAFPSFSRDGKWIYFSSNRTGGDRGIWKLPASGGEAVRVTNSIGDSSSDGIIPNLIRPWSRRMAPTSTTSRRGTGRAPCGGCQPPAALRSRCWRELF